MTSTSPDASSVQITAEQAAVIGHPSNRHGRVLAGPGTGKSTTVLALAKLLQSLDKVIRVVTFTRAATAELAEKAAKDENLNVEPLTMHAFALSLLMRNQDMIDLPTPLRIPDEWEVKNLIHADLARRLRGQGHTVDIRAVKELEREMAARWESLNPRLVLLAKVSPELRNAYLATWKRHRSVFGYSLFAEMPPSTARLLEDHPDASIGDLDFLVVDEYQDLNKSEIELALHLAQRGVVVLGVGDDDQSIYGFRMAAPEGIRSFLADFGTPLDYGLTISQRCAVKILDAAVEVIETAADRPAKPRLKPSVSNPPGVVAYLRFPNDSAERSGVVRLLKHLRDRRGLRPSEMAVLLRSDYNHQWSRPLREAILREDIAATDVEAALAPLHTDSARKLLALARLAVDRHDSLAWWTYLHLTRGISGQYLAGLADDAFLGRKRFSEIVEALPASGAPTGAAGNSQRRAQETVSLVAAMLSALDIAGAPTSEVGWADWFLSAGADLGLETTADLRECARGVGAVTPQELGLGHFLNQLEPVTKDLALKTDGVGIMTMSRSKGLTFRAVVIMGVEKGIIPSEREGADIEEERRLLYVAMTRPREYLYMTMATSRTGPTARTGGGAILESRSRCPFFNDLSLSPEDGTAYLQRLLAQGASGPTAKG